MRSACVSLVVLAVNGFATRAHAQPWVPPQGEGTVSVSYQNYYTKGHYDVFGNRNTNGATHTKAVSTEIDIGLTDNIGLTVGLPFISSKYTGPRPSYRVGGIETFPGPLDDGRYHGAFQDIRVEVRRIFFIGPLAAAPFVGGSFPTHDYETVGEAVPGRRRREIQFGTSVGGELTRLAPGTYAHARYSLAAAERIRGFPAVRSIIDLDGGRALTSRLGLRGLLSWQIRHKGPRPPELIDDWENHDRFIVASYTNLGAGVTIAVTSSTEISANWLATVRGNNGAHVARLLTVGVAWSFGGTFKGFGGSSATVATPSAPYRSTRPPPGCGT